MNQGTVQGRREKNKARRHKISSFEECTNCCYFVETGDIEKVAKESSGMDKVKEDTKKSCYKSIEFPEFR